MRFIFVNDTYTYNISDVLNKKKLLRSLQSSYRLISLMQHQILNETKIFFHRMAMATVILINEAQ